MRRLALLILATLLVATLLPIPVALAGTPTTIAFTQAATGTIQDMAFGTQPKVRLTDMGAVGVEGENITISIGSGTPSAVLNCAGGSRSPQTPTATRHSAAAQSTVRAPTPSRRTVRCSTWPIP